MSEQGLLIGAFVLAAAAFGVSLWSLALGLLNADRAKAADVNRTVERVLRSIRDDRTMFNVCADHLDIAPDDLSARRAYDDAAQRLADSYEELCGALVHMRRDQEDRLYKAYGEEIRTWVEDGPLREKYRWRVPEYPATAEIWRLLRSTSRRQGEGRRAA